MSILKMLARATLVILFVSASNCGNEAPITEQPSDEGQSDAPADLSADSTVEDSPGTCVDQDGDGYGNGCSPGFDCNDENPAVHENAEELCDGLDNNCDDEIDEGCPCLDGSIRHCYSADPALIDVGRCQAGYQICENELWGACLSEILPVAESCDGLDNNCNGEVDEGETNDCGICGDVPDELCGDRLDNNCDGTIDESSAGCDCDDRTHQPCYGGPPHTLGVGLCSGGTFDCEGTDWGICRGETIPTDEVCDGEDNDCDGLTDEGLTNACGDCGVPTPREVCDGVDNDCDGTIDEGLTLTCGQCSAVGLTEQCEDGFDNDCDGRIDEGCACSGSSSCYPGPPELAGVGACETGTRSCDASGEFWEACSGYGLPQPEICDGVDNDCDGDTDLSPDGCDICQTDTEICNGEDDDCDGIIDEYLRNPCDVCIDVVDPEELCGASCCDGVDNDCDGWIDEGLINACGACDDSCYIQQWGIDEDNFDEGEGNGVSDDTSEGLRLGSVPFIYPYLWVANSGEATVTQINMLEHTVVDSYPVGVSPSRTAVDLWGNVWVANRAHEPVEGQGSVTKINSEGCTGTECIEFTINIGSVGDTPRGLAIDENNFAWVGTYFYEACSGSDLCGGGALYQISQNGTIVGGPYPIPVTVYGLAIDSEGIIWISSGPGGGVQGLAAFDIDTHSLAYDASLLPFVIDDCSQPYGIAVDGDGYVWLGNWSCATDLARFDRDSRTFEVFQVGGPSTMEHVRGVAVDADGVVWLVATTTNNLGRLDLSITDDDDPARFRTHATCFGPMGVGISGDGNVWVPCWDGDVNYHHPNTMDDIGTLRAGTNPYTYSDMTGFQLRTFTARQGTWTVTFDCGYPICTLDEVVWSADIPAETGVSVRVRSSVDGVNWSSRVGPLDSSPGDLAGLPDGRYGEVEVTLSTDDFEITPTVESVELLWQRP